MSRHLLLSFLLLTACSLASSAQTLVACNETDPVTKKKRWGFCDRFYSDIVIECKYDSTIAFTEGLGRIKMNGKYGFVDKNGKLVIPAKYDDAMEFREGFAPVFLNGKAFFIDKKGIDVFKKTFKSISLFGNGVAMCEGDDGKRGFIDTKGNIVVPLTLEAAFPFKDKLTAVRFNGEKTWKAINTKGEVVFTFSDKVKTVMGGFSDGMAMVNVDKTSRNNGQYEFVNDKGEFVCDAPYASAQPFKNGRAIINNENKERKGSSLQYFKYGLINKDGRESVKVKYACLEESPIPGIYYYGSTSASISNCNGYGLLDSNGKELTQPVYASFTKLNDTTFLCKETDKVYTNGYLLLTAKGKKIIRLEKDKFEISVFGSDTLVLLWSQTAERDLLISVYHTTKGIVKDDVLANGLMHFKKQKLLLISNWKHATGTLISTTGQILMDKIQTHTFLKDTTLKADIPFMLVGTDMSKDFKMYNLNTRKMMVNDYGFKAKGNPYYSGQFTEGLLPVMQKGKWGFIDTAGKIKLPAIYESAENFHEGWAVVQKSNGEFSEHMVYINKQGKEMPGIKADYLNASAFSEGIAYYVKFNDPLKDVNDESVYYINKSGKEIFKSESGKYLDHGSFSNGLAAVPNKEGKYGYINTKGELVIPYQYTIPKTQYSTVNSIAFDEKGFATVAKDGKTITINKTGK